jgi:hypothetical protein
MMVLIEREALVVHRYLHMNAIQIEGNVFVNASC